ncbi:hypothetical protein [Paenibacillus cymbidii]|uniref:hypothetical protein n=1 Tax=Paenibacillus cymbidii TaxID=1639034 RepID=UPI00107FD6FC|nr:hypothetical protein [Paenibacillus cymbidii]
MFQARGWLHWSYVKASLSCYYWNLHYVILYSLLTVVLLLPVVTAGPAICALCVSMRKVADDRSVKPSEYFRQLTALWKLGLPLSGAMAAGAGGVGCSLFLLTLEGETVYRTIAWTALFLIGMFVLFLFYYPFAVRSGQSFYTTLVQSAQYGVYYAVDTILIICMIVIYYKILAYFSGFAALALIPGTVAFMGARFIHYHNKRIEDEQNGRNVSIKSDLRDNQ